MFEYEIYRVIEVSVDIMYALGFRWLMNIDVSILVVKKEMNLCWLINQWEKVELQNTVKNVKKHFKRFMAVQLWKPEMAISPSINTTKG